MSFIDGLHNRANEVEAYLEALLLNGRNDFESSIYDAMRYSLLAGGKRIRPVILMETGRLYNAKDDDLKAFAAAIEMIHTYSLIHDDLPAMDDDDLRRGRPTNHIVYGEAMAILAGDALLNQAFELMSQRCLISENIQCVKAMSFISKASGVQGMIGGQVADMQSENQPFDKNVLDYIHQHKTSALITAPFVVGGLLGKASQESLEQLNDLGQIMGLIFQITDDILDIESDQEKLGKPIGSDVKNNKMTYPVLYGLQASKVKVDELYQAALKIIESLNKDTDFLKEMLRFFTTRDY